MGHATNTNDVGGPLTAGADLSAKQYHAVQIDPTGYDVVLPADATEVVAGILQNAPASGEAATVLSHGPSSAVAGGSVSRGDRLMSDAAADGRLITWTTTNFVIAIALSDAADGETFPILITCYGPVA
ncbi:MAG: DUF2190 family protein [bacterium]|nr:DUF2190 family protein [bacterium]